MSTPNYVNPPEILVQNYSATSTSTYNNQLTNYGVSPAALVNVFISNTDLAKGVFYDSRALVPVYMRFKSKNGWYSSFVDDEVYSINNFVPQLIETICQPDSSLTLASNSIGQTIRTLNSTTSTLTTNVATNTSNISSLSTTVSGNVSDITTLKSTVATHTSQISSLMASLTTALSRITVLETANLNLGSISGSAVPYTAVSGIQNVSQIATNKANISTLTTNVNSIKSNINSNVAVINANSTSYNNETLADLALNANKQNKMAATSTLTSF